MNLLLDTCVLLWWLTDEPTLSNGARRSIEDGQNPVFVSAASIWEIAIKQGLGKLVLPADFREVLQEQPFSWLDIKADHAFRVRELPFHHRDPFDRMLVAQCLVEGLTLVTRDRVLSRYGLNILQA
ncbi:MAG: type II toxin-antitoxin system VapC family toxin [Bradymonadales bacterium]|nr:type II toxin-antitoxin system VapC family toxin [Bradymonadales bacterium]